MPSTKLSPEASIVIRTISPSVVTLSVPFEFAGGRVKAGGRATVVRLGNGSLLVLSPVTLTEQIRYQLADMGNIGHIAALNIAHHLHVSSCAAAFPEAKVISVEGLPEKREKVLATRGTHFNHITYSPLIRKS